MRLNKKSYIFIFIFVNLFTSQLLFGQWKQVTTIPSPYSNIYWLDVFFLNNNPDYGWICGYGGQVIRTTDGGFTWSGTKIMSMKIDSFNVGGIIVYDTSYAQAVNQLESIHFANEYVGYTSGEGMVFKSTDGGASWKSVIDTNNFQGDVWGVFFATPDAGVAIGSGCDGRQVFRRTTNGGQSWNIFFSNEPNSGLSDAILESPDGDGYAASSGFIWKTTNGGETWYKFSRSGDNDWQEEITYVGNTFLVPFSESCYGGGEGGGWRISTNSGQSWREFKIDATMFGAYLLDEKKGWVCGQKQQIHYTSDAGKTWELRNCGIRKNMPLDDIWFVNDTLGWVVGQGVYKFHLYDTVYPKILSNYPLYFCEGDSLELYCKQDYNYYRWSNGDTTKRTTIHKPGVYSLIAYNDECDFVFADSVEIKIFPETKFEILTNKKPEFCEGDSLKLWVNVKYIDLIWSTGHKTDSIYVKNSGTYSVTIIDTNGCIYSKSIDVIMHYLPDAKIQTLGKLEFCEGDSVILQTTEDYATYRWSKTSNPDSIISQDRKVTIFHSGIYYVIVENEFGCVDTSQTVFVNVLDLSNRLEIFSDKKPRSLDFDSLGLTKMNCDYINILNTSDEIVPLEDILLSINVEFSIPQKQLPFLLFPGDTNRLLICFRPLDFGIRRDTITIGDTCSTHFIPLSGIGKANKYTIESDCNVEIIATTKALLDDEFFISGNVYPNPSNNIFSISFVGKSFNELPIMDCKLYNSLGIFVSSGILKNFSIIKNEQSFTHSGQWQFDTDDLPNGVYFLLIKYSNYQNELQVIINK